MITAKTKLCIIIGNPVEHSLSPQIHNAGYEAAGIVDKFVFLAAHVKVENVETVARAMKAMNIRGITCTIPHKIEIMKYLDEIDPIAEKIGATNTVVNENGTVKGYNTDWLGILIPLQQKIKLKNKNVLLLGAGGAAHAAAYAMQHAHANLFIHNRTAEKARKLVEKFGGNVVTTITDSFMDSIDIIINTTSVGLAPNEYETPLAKKYLRKQHIVFDAIYSPYETRLLREAKEQGGQIIHGTEMLLHQAYPQFELYTGKKAPEEIMRKTLYILLEKPPPTPSKEGRDNSLYSLPLEG